MKIVQVDTIGIVIMQVVNQTHDHAIALAAGNVHQAQAAAGIVDLSKGVVMVVIGQKSIGVQAKVLVLPAK